MIIRKCYERRVKYEHVKGISVERLREYCRAYDEIRGEYPGSYWEGEAVLDFILECEGLK